MAAFNLEEPFTYADGALAGLSGGTNWSGAWAGATGTVNVTSNIVVATSNASEPFRSRLTVSNIDSGDAYFIGFYKDAVVAVSSGWSIYTFDGGTAGTYVGTNAAFAIRDLNNSGITLEGTTVQTLVGSGTIATSTPYDIHVNWVSPTSVRARYKLSTDNVWNAYTSAVTLQNSKSQINHIGVICNDDLVDTFGYLDKITSVSPVSSTVSNSNILLMGVG